MDCSFIRQINDCLLCLQLKQSAYQLFLTCISYYVHKNINKLDRKQIKVNLTEFVMLCVSVSIGTFLVHCAIMRQLYTLEI